MLSDEVPVVAILKCLSLRGWSVGPPPAFHVIDSPKHFGTANFVKFRHYLQCLVDIDKIWQRGLTMLSSQQPALYYQCVLAAAAPCAVATNKSDVYYKSLLGSDAEPVPIKDIDSDSSDPVLPSGPIPAKKPRLGTARASMSQLTSVPDTPKQQVDSGHAAHEVAAAPSEAAKQNSMDPVPHSEGLSDDMPIAMDTEVDAVYVPWPTGQLVTVDCHLRPGDVGHYKRLLIKCPLTGCTHFGHNVCQKYRSLSHAHMATFGPREPEAYLIAWAEAASSFTDRASHMRHRPSIAAVREVIVRWSLANI